eukprot:3073280-Amphidinium_carterae.1
MPLKAAYTSVALDSLGAATGDAAEEVGTCPAAPSSSRTSIQDCGLQQQERLTQAMQFALCGESGMEMFVTFSGQHCLPSHRF